MRALKGQNSAYQAIARGPADCNRAIHVVDMMRAVEARSVDDAE